MSVDLSGLRVTIVDDVMTTGATLEELARTLKRAGAREVTAWVLARTPRVLKPTSNRRGAEERRENQNRQD